MFSQEFDCSRSGGFGRDRRELGKLQIVGIGSDGADELCPPSFNGAEHCPTSQGMCRSATLVYAAHEMNRALLSAFQRVAVPLGKFCSGFVGCLAEVENVFLWRLSGAHVVVLENEFSQLRIPISRAGEHGFFVQSRRLWRGVRIESRVRESPIPRPKPATDAFVRITLAGQCVRIFWQGGATSRKTSHRQIEAAPEKMHWTALAQEW